ncbi:unnamed protein product [Brassica oleracea]
MMMATLYGRFHYARFQRNVYQKKNISYYFFRGDMRKNAVTHVTSISKRIKMLMKTSRVLFSRPNCILSSTFSLLSYM